MCGLFRIPVKELFKYSERLTETGYELQHFKSCFHILWRCSLTVQRAKRLAWAHSEIFTTHFWLYFDQKRPIFKWNGPSSFILYRKALEKGHTSTHNVVYLQNQRKFRTMCENLRCTYPKRPGVVWTEHDSQIASGFSFIFCQKK